MSNPRKIHRLISDGTDVVAVMETSSSGGRWGIPVNLQIVRCAVDNFDQLSAHRINGNPDVKMIRIFEVDARNKGPRSAYGKTLNALIEEAADHLKGEVAYERSNVMSTNQDVRDELRCVKEQVLLQRELAQFMAVPSGAKGGAGLDGDQKDECRVRARRM